MVSRVSAPRCLSLGSLPLSASFSLRQAPCCVGCQRPRASSQPPSLPLAKQTFASISLYMVLMRAMLCLCHALLHMLPVGPYLSTRDEASTADR